MKNRFRGLSDSRKLEMLQLSVEDIYNQAFLDGHIEGYENGELNERRGYGSVEVVKSPNQQRADLIQRAREFVENKSTSHVNEGVISFWPKGMKNKYFSPSHEVEFVVNKSKRTVVCLIKGLFCGSVRYRGIAKCHPDEVFNADIGKAIALARALEIEVPHEFLQAVQPTEVVAGMLVVGDAGAVTNLKRTCIEVEGDRVYTMRGRSGWLKKPTVKILDDTNAIYEEESK